MKIAVLKELYPGERRVALVPANVPQLAKANIEVLVEAGAGVEAGFPDHQYTDKGATVVPDRGAALAADILLQVRSVGLDAESGANLRHTVRPGQTVIGSCDPLGKP